MWGKICAEMILSPSVGFICLYNVATRWQVQKEKQTVLKTEVDAEPADSWKKTKVSHISSPCFKTKPHICSTHAQAVQDVTGKLLLWHENKQNKVSSAVHFVYRGSAGNKKKEQFGRGKYTICESVLKAEISWEIKLLCCFFFLTDFSKQGKNNNQII